MLVSFQFMTKTIFTKSYQMRGWHHPFKDHRKRKKDNTLESVTKEEDRIKIRKIQNT